MGDSSEKLEGRTAVVRWCGREFRRGPLFRLRAAWTNMLRSVRGAWREA